MQVRFRAALHPDISRMIPTAAGARNYTRPGKEAMHIHSRHPWNLAPKQAITLQRDLAKEVLLESTLTSSLRTVAGVDLSPPDKTTGLVRGAVVVLSYPEFEVLEVATAEDRPLFPYVPGLLSFRESPVLVQALERLNTTPDLLLVDGQGIAHPRRFGIACHLGLLAEIPTIGCAKSRLIGTYEEPGTERGSWTPLQNKGETIGAVVRTRSGVNPIYVSPGHRVDLETSVRWALACSPRFRVPIPTRQAHLAAAGEPLNTSSPRKA